MNDHPVDAIRFNRMREQYFDDWWMNTLVGGDDLEAVAHESFCAGWEAVRQIAAEKQATYWVGPDTSLVPRRPFVLLLDRGELEE